jgi:SAM-dependent methyltransferase
MTTPVDPAPVHDWREAGAAWGHDAVGWSCLWEHYALDVILAVVDRLGVGPGRRVLDIACGSGLAARLAAGAGATVVGIDASEDLIAVARARVPGADLRVGSMFALPWPDASVDAAYSINGVWGGCVDALREARRVLAPGGLLAISFWGPGPPLDLRPCFKAMARHAPTPHLDGMKRTNDIARPGVAEQMLRDAGLDVLERGGRVSVVEWPEAELAWRAISSIGPAAPALVHGDVDALRRDLLAALEHCRDARGIYRFRNDHQFVVARRPGPDR